jgi:hypothetical protein
MSKINLINVNKNYRLTIAYPKVLSLHQFLFDNNSLDYRAIVNGRDICPNDWKYTVLQPNSDVHLLQHF